MKVYTVLNQFTRDCVGNSSIVATCNSRDKAMEVLKNSVETEKQSDIYAGTEVTEYIPDNPFLVGIQNHDYENCDEWGIFETELIK